MTQHYKTFKRVIETRVPCHLQKGVDARWYVVTSDDEYQIESFDGFFLATSFCEKYGITLTGEVKRDRSKCCLPSVWTK